MDPPPPPDTTSQTTTSTTTTSTTTDPPSPPPTPPPSSSNTSPSTTGTTSSGVSTTSSVPTSTSVSTPTSTSTSVSVPITTPTLTTPSASPSSSSRPIVTVTSQVTYTPSTTPTTITGNANGSSKGFFDNKGAVAGVFTVVGLVGLAIVIALVTNIIRRRRAKQFDREIAEAAEEAAKAPAPIFLDDDDDGFRTAVAAGGFGGRGDYEDYPHGGTYGRPGPYSDASSHGTYSQPPMSTGESYNMHDIAGHHGAGTPGELYNPYAASGAAGVGVARARSTRDPGNFAAGLTEGAAPYAAFAGPGYNQSQNYGGYNNNNAYGAAGGYHPGPGSPEYDLLDAAGMNGGNATGGAVGAAGVQRGMSLAHQADSHLPYTGAGAGPQRSPSGNRSTESASIYTTPSANYPSGAGQSAPAMPHQDAYVNYGADQEDPYGGYAGDQHSRSGHGHIQHGVADAESDGEDETRRGARVLRVANE